MGLDLQLFEEEVPMDLVCAICNKVLVNPVLTACSHLFCNACLKRRLRRKATGTSRGTCPTCNTRLGNKTEAPSVPIKVKLLNLLVRCSHSCGKVCTLAELPDHVAEDCPQAPVACPHVQQGCKMKIKRAEVKEHEEECDYRRVQCEACGHRTIYAELFTHQSRKRCLEKKLRQQLIRAIRDTNTDVRQHRHYLQRQHIRLEQQQRQRMMDHYRQTTTASRLQRRSNLHGNSNGDSSNCSEYDSPRVILNGETGQDKPQHVHIPHDALRTSSQPMEDGEMTIALNTPSPSRTGLMTTCRNCKRQFRENTNSPNSCRWHPGTCYSCGRLDYQKGCMMGYHKL